MQGCTYGTASQGQCGETHNGKPLMVIHMFRMKIVSVLLIDRRDKHRVEVRKLGSVVGKNMLTV